MYKDTDNHMQSHQHWRHITSLIYKLTSVLCALLLKLNQFQSLFREKAKPLIHVDIGFSTRVISSSRFCVNQTEYWILNFTYEALGGSSFSSFIFLVIQSLFIQASYCVTVPALLLQTATHTCIQSQVKKEIKLIFSIWYISFND